MTEQAFTYHRAAALALLNSGIVLTRKAGSFLGQLVADATPMTAAQRDLASQVAGPGIATASCRWSRAMTGYPDAAGHRGVDKWIAAADVRSLTSRQKAS